MRMTQLKITNYRALRDVTIPLSKCGCLIGENNTGKSSILLALKLFFSGSKLAAANYFDESTPIRIAVSFEDIGEPDLARLATEHAERVRGILSDGTLTLVRRYDTSGKSELRYVTLMPRDERFSIEQIGELLKRQRPGQAFVDKVVAAFPEIADEIDTNMNKDAMRQKIQVFADSLPDDEKDAVDLPLPTGIDKSIIPMLPEPIYIPAVKDLADDIKTTESTPFGKILSILLHAVESKLPEARKLFDQLNRHLNRVIQDDGTVVDERLDEVKLIETTVEKYVRESFGNVDLQIEIPPPELKTVFAGARINAYDGVWGSIETKGDGLRRAIVFSILRSYVELNTTLGTDASGDTRNEEHAAATLAPASYLLLFEEPELYLHPQAQHILFEALRIFAQDHHALVTTHSPLFFGPSTTETFVKLCKTENPAVADKPFTVAQPIDLSDLGAKDQFQIICFENNNAAFFADTVILVEGDSDYLVLPHIAKTLNPEWNTARRPIHFARITGKGNIRRYRQFFQRFGVRVPVIADLDLLTNGFQHIEPDEAMKGMRDDLLTKVDDLIVPDADPDMPSGADARTAHDSGELRALWRRVRELQAEHQAGTCTPDDLNQAIEEFFAWQRQSDRLAVLMNTNDTQMLQLKWRLLEMLRQADVYVLERGAIEQYYPDSIRGGDKPSRAQDFCSKVTTCEAALTCCGEQKFMRNGTMIEDSEFNLIFGGIFGEPAVND